MMPLALFRSTWSHLIRDASRVVQGEAESGPPDRQVGLLHDRRQGPAPPHLGGQSEISCILMAAQILAELCMACF